MHPATEFHIFRDAHRRMPAADLVARLKAEADGFSSCPSIDQLMSSLLLAGELECALEDSEAPVSQRKAAAAMTLLFAEAAIQADSPAQAVDGPSLHRVSAGLCHAIKYAGEVSVGTPEGFAYYTLHPLDYSDLIARVKPAARRTFVIGIRTIGTTLGAAVCAKLNQLGIEADRTTVRPMGHPYERRCVFTLHQQRAIADVLGSGGQFVVCDEGPGRSGSSLLSVAEALEREGVPPEGILMLCSHEPDVSKLCTPDAVRRWGRYRHAAAGMTKRLPSAARENLGGGAWRRLLIPPDQLWPAVWPQMERLKYCSADRRTLFNFEGYGPYGAQVRERNERLSASGFAARYLGQENGFGAQLLPEGRLARREDLTRERLAQMGQYCAWRAREFAVPDVDTSNLEEMANVNLGREFGTRSERLTLPVERPTICDNRMAPHHWLLAADGRWYKLDGAIHGDDHFFPGPCDIAWDLAGIVVEWELSRPARSFLLAQYSLALEDDDVNARLENYEVAYAMFRLAWSAMTAESVEWADEKCRLLLDAKRYRRFLLHHPKLTSRFAGASVVTPLSA